MTNIFSKKDAQRKNILAIPFNTFLKPPKVVPNKHLAQFVFWILIFVNQSES